MSLLPTCSPRYFFFWGELHIVYLNRGGGARFFRVGNVSWFDVHQLTFIHHFLNQFWIASRLVCSFCEAIAGSLSVASTAVSSAKFALVDSGEVDRSEVYSKYNSGPRTLP
jgi:hypothetical protein